MTDKEERGPFNLSRRLFFRGASASAAGAALAAGSIQVVRPPRAAAAQDVVPVVKVSPSPGAPGTELMRLTVNSTVFEVAVDSRWTLAELLREGLGLTGTKVGCDRGECGTCTVLLDGKPVLSCMTLALEVGGRTVRTVEGLASQGQLSPLQQAFWEHGGTQCGFCTPGMLMSATALLEAQSKPSEDEVRQALSGNLCRCTGYTKIVESVLAASGQPVSS